MKKTTFSFFVLLALLLCVQYVYAQVPNSTLENWTPSGNPPPFDWEEPTNWKSTNALTEWTYAGCRKSTIKHGGTYALQLQSTNISGGRASIVCNGSPVLISDFSNPDIDIITGGTPVAGKPIALNGWYRFDNGMANDSGYGVVILKKYNGSKRDTVSIGTFYFAPAATYTAFTIPLADKMPGIMPDSIVIAFYSSNPANPKAPNFSKTGLLIDDLSLSHPTSVPGLIAPTVSLFPNPVSGDLVTLQAGQALLSSAVDIYDLQGRLVHTGTLASGQLDISMLRTGTYLVRTQHNDAPHFTRLVKE